MRMKKTHLYARHEACSIGYKLVSDFPELAEEPYQFYTGENVVDWFMTKLRDLERRCMDLLFDDQRLVMTQADWHIFNSSYVCYICHKALHPDDKVRDHDHITGKFRGAAHNRCNLMLRKTYKIPVFFHNFRGYDSHLVVWGLSKFPTVDISLIGQGMEKYLTLAWGEHLVFKDSYQFLAGSLETLCSNLLRSGKEKFKQMMAGFTRNNQPHQHFELLLRKGIFPYAYVDAWGKLDDNALPPRDSFFNELRNEECSEADYGHAARVWDGFQCRTLKGYMELYLKTDVLILADIFEEFREVCTTNYGLDPAHYISAPQLSWDSMLKLTECKLELISDPEMFSCIDPGIRGGVSMITTRFARANNPYMSTFDPALPTSYIIYLDANNLYGWAMSMPMPNGGFTWLLEVDYKNIDWLAQTEEQDMGYFIECDLDYPPDLHELHNDYPLAQERVDVKVEMLSGNGPLPNAPFKQRY